jgi:uncharacterized protein (DUF433 family)
MMEVAESNGFDLGRPVYTVVDAARILRVPTTSFRRWLDGQSRKGVFYDPVIRPESTGSDLVTWGEFIEGGFLREYRNAGPPFRKIRLLVDDLRAASGALYPLAHHQPYVDPHFRELFVALEDAGGPRMLSRGPRSRESGSQVVWAEPVLAFLERVDFEGDIARRYFPYRREGLVVVDPEISFGLPSVEGIRTERIVEAHDAGESVTDIARSWDLTPFHVEQALRWERELLAA